MQAGVSPVHSFVSSQLEPESLQVSTMLLWQRRSPGAQDTQAPAWHTGVSPPHAGSGVHRPLSLQRSGPISPQRTTPEPASQRRQAPAASSQLGAALASPASRSASPESRGAPKPSVACCSTAY